MPQQPRLLFAQLVALLLWPLLLVLSVSGAWATGPSQQRWEMAQRIDASDYAEPPLIAADKRGNAIAVWVQFDALPQQAGVWTNRYTAGKGWGTPEHINDYIGQASQPALAINARGEAIVAWIQYGLSDPDNPGAPIRSSLWTNHYGPAKGWGKPLQIQDDTVNPAAPKVAIDDRGNAIAVWHQQNAALDITNVYGKHHSKQEGWGTAQLLQTDTTTQGYYPQVAMTDAGDAMVAWGRIDPSTFGFDMASNRYSARTGWMTPETLPGSDGAIGSPEVGIDDRGNAIAIWSRMDISSFQNNVFASRYGVRHGWDVPELLQPRTDIDGSQLRLAMNDRGEAIALWREVIDPMINMTGDYTYEMHANRYVPGKGWEGSQQVGSTAVYPDTGATNPQIGMDEHGNAIVVLEQPNYAAQTDPWAQPPSNILAFRFSVSRGWGDGRALQNGTDNASNAKVSVTRNGDAFAVWQQQDMNTGATSLWANRYDKP